MKPNPKLFDKVGSPWTLDKNKKKLKRMIQQIVNSGSYSKYNPGEIVNYDGGMFITKAKVIRKINDDIYEIDINGKRYKVQENTLFKEDDLYE